MKVETSSGIVTLSGSSQSLTGKKYADMEAKKIKGVSGVINKLDVEPEFRYDWDVAQDIRHRLLNSSFIRSHFLGVTVSDGQATLTGEVDSWAQKQWAELLAGEVRGVKGVKNDLTIKYSASRPDKEVADDVVATIARDVYLTGLPITATVKEGTVTLTGTVGNWLEKERATDQAYCVSGVRHVKNDLSVEWWKEYGVRKSTPAPSDDQLQKTVRDELYEDLRVDPFELSVDASLGWITLRGSVPTYFQRGIAEQDARDIVGVTGVTNLLSVGPFPRSDNAIKSEIVSDVASDYSLNGQDLTVSVNHGIVTLTGNVNEYYEKYHATDVATRVKGVCDVINLLEVNRPPKFTDSALAERVKDRLRQDDETRWVADQIHVSVEDGKATLTGDVNFWSERDQAQHVAFLTDGIWSVDNQIKVLTD
jgi:osmotically-inducible protein OsmY